MTRFWLALFSPFCFSVFSAMALSWIFVDTTSFGDCMLLHSRSFTFITISRSDMNAPEGLGCGARSNLLWNFKSSSVKS